MEFFERGLFRPSLYNATEWIYAARTWPILVYRTARFAHKRATHVIALQHLECDYRQARPWADVMRGVALEELSGGELQSLLETEYIVWGQELIQVAAAAIKTIDVRVARKFEGII